MPSSEPLVSEPEKQDSSPNAKAGRAAAKPRTRRPRPTFEDGSLTRVFKFPSKSYPRSSYYVTADEIVIRIKKARRRWKLVVPKKRLVSYKTNRWFAKPRWVEIELTYTQALKLKLIEPKAAAPEASSVQPEQSASAHVDRMDQTDHARSAIETGAFVFSPEPAHSLPADQAVALDSEADSAPDEEESEGVDDAMTISEDETAEDPAEEWDEASAEDMAADTAGARDETEPQPEEQPQLPLSIADAQPSVSETEPVEEPAIEQEALVPVAMAQAETPLPEPAADTAEEEAKPEAELEAKPEPEATTNTQVASVSGAEPEALTLPDPEPAQQRIVLPPIASVPHVPPRTAITTPVSRGAPPKARRFDARLWASTLMLTAAAAGWIAVQEWQAAQGEPVIACASSSRSAACGEQIVTGSLAQPQDGQPAAEPLPSAVPPQQPAPAIDNPPQIEIASPRLPPSVVEAPVPVATPPQAPAVVEPAPAVATREPTPPEPVVVLAAPAPPPSPPAAVAKQVEPAVPQAPAQTAGNCSTILSAAQPVTVYFDFASSSLDQTALATLASFAARLRGCASAVVTIEGHTDSDGAAERNHALSVRRANEVLAHLVDAGVKSERLSALGFGHSRPQAPNNTPENKQANRRVTIRIATDR